MTVRDMLDLYQGWIDDYKGRWMYIASLDDNPESRKTSRKKCEGIIKGLKKAYDELAKYEKEGLEPCSK